MKNKMLLCCSLLGASCYCYSFTATTYQYPAIPRRVIRGNHRLFLLCIYSEKGLNAEKQAFHVSEIQVDERSCSILVVEVKQLH